MGSDASPRQLTWRFGPPADIKKAGQTVYLDLFAGRPDNISRDREQRVIRGSARRALDTQPPLSHLRLFELAGNASGH
ncbi:MAG TPA: hypothetical protein VMU94_16545 [Streptosporangiaceae bacterium]|nr:hypothetical protein [Streptosporangiaceae bacterium]